MPDYSRVPDKLGLMNFRQVYTVLSSMCQEGEKVITVIYVAYLIYHSILSIFLRM